VLLLVNSSDRSASVEIVVPPFAGLRLGGVGERRSVDVTASGLLRDRVDAFGVRVYAERPELVLASN
jgi:hypothetical protein